MSKDRIKELEFNIPSNLDIRRLLQDTGKGIRYIDCNIDKFHWFLDCLFVRSTLEKNYTLGDFIPMNTTIMEDILGVRYVQDIKRLLIETTNVIETDSTDGFDGKKDMRIGKKSIGYRLTSEYQVKHIRVLQDSESTFIKTLRLVKDGEVFSMDKVTRTSLFHLNDIGIYYEAAVAYVEYWYQLKTETPDLDLMKKLKKQNRRRLIIENRIKRSGKNLSSQVLTYPQMLELMKDAYLYQINAVNERLWIPKRDDKGRRIHTFLTNLWKELRQFLYYMPDPSLQIVGLDCSNSQPYTLVKIILDYFSDSDELPADAQLYISLVTKGELYKYLWTDMGRDLNDSAFIDFKTDLFSYVYYSENHKGFHSEEAKAFYRLFPTVYQIIMYEKKYDFDQLSIEMQKVETKAVVDGALTFLFNKYEDKVFFASIHDSILCPKDYEEEVREVMLYFYTETVGVTPHIKPAANINQIKEATAIQTTQESSALPVMTLSPSKKTDKKAYKILSDEEVWELQEAEEWGDENAARLLKLVEEESELDFTYDDMPFYRKTYKILKQHLEAA